MASPVKVGKSTRTNFHFIGFERSDPLPRLMRRYMTLKQRETALVKAMRDAAEKMKEKMGKLAPRRTGELSRSYASAKLKKAPNGVIGIRVGAISGKGVFKGQSFGKAGWRDHWAELGTRNHPGKPHVQPAIKQHLGQYRAKLRANLAGILKQLNRI